MKIEASGDSILIKGVVDFNPDHVFDCGQAFRWKDDGTGYIGVVKNNVVRISYSDNTLKIENSTLHDYKSIWRHYLDLDKDYGAIKKYLSSDSILKKAVKYGYGVRILNQDPWETLISFIISANNNISRIKNIIERLCTAYGEPLYLGDEVHYTFPSPERLAAVTEDDLKICGCGYRTKYIKSTARMVYDRKICLEEVKGLPYNEAHEALMACAGVGPKVADCVLLFSFEKGEAFPVDVWVKRVMEYFYTGRQASVKEIKKLAAEKFGPYAGLAQQYLFYYAREKKIGKS